MVDGLWATTGHSAPLDPTCVSDGAPRYGAPDSSRRGLGSRSAQLLHLVSVGALDIVDRLLGELHDRHMLVLDDRPDRRGEIRMALPFAAEPTDFRVTTESGSRWANCAWDSLAVLAALHADGRIESTWSDTGEPLDISTTDGQLDCADGLISFALPASQWWDDIVLT